MRRPNIMIGLYALMLLLVVLLGCASAVPPPQGVAEQAGIIPDLIDTAPNETVQVEFNSGVSVNFGNSLTPSQVAELPTFSWPAESDAMYTLLFVDPDAHSRAHPNFRSILHCLIGNIPGNDTRANTATTIAPFAGSAPGQGTGPHRYTFFVYKQPSRIDFRIAPVPSGNSDRRKNFTVRTFAEEYELGEPVAYNFYNCEYQAPPPSSATSISSNMCSVIMYTIVLQLFAVVTKCQAWI